VAQRLNRKAVAVESGMRLAKPGKFTFDSLGGKFTAEITSSKNLSLPTTWEFQERLLPTRALHCMAYELVREWQDRNEMPLSTHLSSA
jgi:hypothetical protein